MKWTSGLHNNRSANQWGGGALGHLVELSHCYSRGQTKSTNKNGNSLMVKKVTGKHADMLRKGSGQISAKSHKPLWRKCPYKKIIPEILASTPKSARKNMKNSAIASFHGEQSAHQFSKQVISQFSWKKMLNIDPNWRFDVMSCWHALHKQGMSSAIHLLSCGNTGNWQGKLLLMLSLYFLISFWPILITSTNFSWFFSHFNLFFIPNVAVFRSKILATRIYRGKNFGGVFFGVFCKLEQESKKIGAVDTLFTEIPN